MKRTVKTEYVLKLKMSSGEKEKTVQVECSQPLFPPSAGLYRR